MNSREIIYAAIKTRGYTQSLLAEKAGYKTTSTINDMLARNKNGMRVDNFIKLLEIMDFEVVVRSKTKSGEEWKVCNTDTQE